MANTYELIASTNLTTSAATISFTSIAANWTDLLLVVSLRTDRNTGSVSDIYLTYNGSTSGYSAKSLYGVGSATGSSNGGSTNWYFGDANQIASNTTSTFNSASIYIPNYAGSNYKSGSSDLVLENNSSTNNELMLQAGLWSNTAAITSMTLTPISGANWAAYSSAYLYGIKNS